VGQGPRRRLARALANRKQITYQARPDPQALEGLADKREGAAQNPPRRRRLAATPRSPGRRLPGASNAVAPLGPVAGRTAAVPARHCAHQGGALHQANQRPVWVPAGSREPRLAIWGAARPATWLQAPGRMRFRARILPFGRPWVECSGRSYQFQMGGQIDARGSGASPRPCNVAVPGLARLRPVAPRRRSHCASGLGAKRWSQIWDCWVDPPREGGRGLDLAGLPGRDRQFQCGADAAGMSGPLQI